MSTTLRNSLPIPIKGSIEVTSTLSPTDNDNSSDMLEVNRPLTSTHVCLGSSSDLVTSTVNSNSYETNTNTLSTVSRMLDNIEVLNRLNGNYNAGGGYGLDRSYFTREKHDHSGGNCNGFLNRPSCSSRTSVTKLLLEDILTVRHDHVWNRLEIAAHNHNVNPKDQIRRRVQSQGTRKYEQSTLETAKISDPKKVKNAAYQYLLRRQQRSRKFRLNLFMYGALYRKQKKVENNYAIYHNPMEDPDATYTSFSNPNYFFNRAHHHLYNNNNDSSIVNGNTHSISLEKLSLSSDFFSPRKGSFSSYSSCDQTPTTPDRTLILQKLYSPSDDDDIEADDDIPYGEVQEPDKVPLMKENGDINTEEEPRVYYGVGSQQCKRSRGILGYLEMLEKEAMEREMKKLNGGDDGDNNDEKERGDEDNDDSPKTMQGGDQPVEPPRTEKFHLGTEINSPDSNDSGFQTGEKTPIIFSPQTPGAPIPAPMEEAQEAVPNKEVLPEGWQKHEDDDGPYYWHVKSGTIQRDPPPPAPPDGPFLCSPKAISLASESSSSLVSSVPSTPTSESSGTGRHLAEFEGHALQYAAKSLQSLSTFQENTPASSKNKSSGNSVRFAVRSLGWVKIAEEDLTLERSSKAVNKCIVDLSLGRNDINDAVGRWGDGKNLFMDLDHTSLRLVDVVDGVVLNSQPIHSIRVWGVGRDNGRERDFAYVARDRGTSTHMCHVFHCETPACEIANTLRDICKKIMLERSLHQSAVARLTRPTDLPNLEKIGQPKGEKLSFQKIYNNARFPTPMEEPRKVMKCHYLGALEVTRPTGRDTLNEAIQHLYYSIPPEKWKFVTVAVAPSTITVTEHGNPDGIIEEYRVRFLSFMGIAADNVRMCAFIMHTSQNKFICHVFHCEPSAGPLCKTIEAACKLRYQKCLDAHPQTPKGGLPGKSVKDMISAGVKAGVQGFKGAKLGTVQGMMGMLSLFKGMASSESVVT